jgi:pimeloyl-ACP methyl ester carboxylesterase
VPSRRAVADETHVERVRSFDGTRIAYAVQGAGPAVLLLHGFAADHVLNWARPGVIDALTRAGRRVIATDARGHGASDKPHDPDRYAGNAMARDAQAVLDHLGVEQVDVVGYSMGAMVAARLVPDEPRTGALVLGGVGATVAPPRTGGRAPEAIAAALLAEDPASIPNVAGKAFRQFADATGADRHALAALSRSSALRFEVRFDAITVPTLVVVGADDTLIRSPDELADRLPSARLVTVAGDHLGAPYDPAFAQAIVDFLDQPRSND